MPAIPADAPRHAHKLRDITIEVPYLFAEGHALTTPEASFLNRAVASALINSHGTTIRNALDALDTARAEAFKAKKYDGPRSADGKSPAKATMADLGDTAKFQADFDAKFTSYAIGETNRGDGSSASSDPVTVQARFIASGVVRTKILAKGFKVKAFHDAKDENGVSKFTHAVNKTLADNPWIMEKAKRDVAEIAAQSASAPDDLDFGPTPEPIAAE